MTGEPQCCAALLLRVYTGISDEAMTKHLAECEECKEIRAGDTREDRK